MSLRDLEYLIKERIYCLSKEELEDYIIVLKIDNNRKRRLLHSPILTCNTGSIYNSAKFNDFLIELSEERLKEFGKE